MGVGDAMVFRIVDLKAQRPIKGQQKSWGKNEREVGKKLGEIIATDKQGLMVVIYGNPLGAASMSWSCSKTLAFLSCATAGNHKYGLLAWFAVPAHPCSSH
jgi:hypothetical protein